MIVGHFYSTIFLERTAETETEKRKRNRDLRVKNSKLDRRRDQGASITSRGQMPIFAKFANSGDGHRL